MAKRHNINKEAMKETYYRQRVREKETERMTETEIKKHIEGDIHTEQERAERERVQCLLHYVSKTLVLTPNDTCF